MLRAGRPDGRLEQYLRDSLRILEVNLRLARGEEPACYRAAAAQLRLLLCDTTRQHGRIVDISLAGRLLPELRLTALDGAAHSGAVPRPAGRQQEDLDRLAWLEQELALPDGMVMSVRSIIRLACDNDGGAHVDLPAGPLPEVRQSILFIGEAALQAFRTALA